jgi:peptidoglycan-associated lipoprotein
MMMFESKRVLRYALIAAAAATLAACAGKPAPAPQPQPGPAPAPAPSAPVTQTPTGPIPGSEQDFIVNVGDRVYFDFDQYVIRDDARPVLDAQAVWLNRYSSVRVRIEGNADERGTREYNMALGARRANAVRDYLVSRGVSAGRIETISYGKERPIDGGSNEAAWARNRNGHTAIVSGAR